jgi:DNA-binding beta-propeller fold protein YncE
MEIDDIYNTEFISLSRDPFSIYIRRGEVSGMAINPNTNILYLANAFNGTVSVVNVSSLSNKSEVIPIPGPDVHPDAIAVNPKTNMLYVSDRFSGKVYVIDGRSHFIRPIQVSIPSPMLGGLPIRLDQRSNLYLP